MIILHHKMSKQLFNKTQQLKDENKQCIDRVLSEIKTIVNDPATLDQLKNKVKTGVRRSVIYEEKDKEKTMFGWTEWFTWSSPKTDESCFWRNRDNYSNQKYIKTEITKILKDAGYNDNGFELTWSRYIDDSSADMRTYWVPGDLAITW